MAFALPVTESASAPTFFALSGAALDVSGALTNNKLLDMASGLIGIGGAFATVAGAGGAEGFGAATAVAEGAEAASPLSAAGDAMDFPSFSQSTLSGADPTLSNAASSVTEPALDQRATGQKALEELINGPAESGGAMDMYGVKAPGQNGMELPLGQASKPLGPLAQLGQQAEAGKTWYDRIMDSKFMSSDATKAGLVSAVAGGISKGFGRDPKAEAVDLARKRLDAEMAELARRNANSNNVTGVNVGMRPNQNANLYPGGVYRPVRVGLANRALSA